MILERFASTNSLVMLFFWLILYTSAALIKVKCFFKVLQAHIYCNYLH